MNEDIRDGNGWTGRLEGEMEGRRGRRADKRRERKVLVTITSEGMKIMEVHKVMIMIVRIKP